MRNYKNVFQIFNDLDKQIPFKVRRWSWHRNSFFEITRIEPDGKGYGKAWGNFHGQEENLNIPLSCAGCYQWELVNS